MASRLAAYVSQVNAIEAAASAARSKGFSTNGKIVGPQAIAAAVAGGSGTTVADIGEELNIEADELDPNAVAPGTPNPQQNAAEQSAQILEKSVPPQKAANPNISEQEWDDEFEL